MSELPHVNLVIVTEVLFESSDDVDSFSEYCGAAIGRDEVEHLRPLLRQTLDYHSGISAVGPWVGYISVCLTQDVKASEVVGCCGFKGNPNERDEVEIERDEVEIAYHTFSGHESRGYAKAMVQQLLGIAEASGRVRCVVAHTLPEENASTSILKKIGFAFDQVVEDPEDGTIWRWTKMMKANDG